MRQFYCDNSIHAFSVLWISSPPPFYLLSPSGKPVWWVSLCCHHTHTHTHTHTHIQHIVILFPPQYPFFLSSTSYWFLSHTVFPPFTFMSNYYQHHHSRPRFHKWVGTHNIWFFKAFRDPSTWWSLVAYIFLQVT
jgi:hypothetical protein